MLGILDILGIWEHFSHGAGDFYQPIFREF